MAAATAQSNAINIHVFRNGDSHYKGRKFVVNHRQTRNFDSFLSMVTTGVKPQNGAVRKLYTPTNGHKVDDLSSLENNKFYVAAGTERFRKVQYFSIGRPDGQRQVSILQRSIKPVAHSRIKASAKIRKPADGPKTIHVYRNGDTLYPSVRLLLTKRMLSHWDIVLQVITDRVNLINGAVRKLWHMDGSRVIEISEIENEGSYVASGQERFKKVAYGINGPLDPSSPRLKKPSPPKVKPAITRKPTKLSQKVIPPRKETKKSPPKPEKKKKKEKTAEQKEAETVFHSKPAIVKRSREKEASDVLDFGEGESGVFKAKEGRKETRGASEIQETRETAIDLPIDQIAAEEVEDEVEDQVEPPIPDEAVVDPSSARDDVHIQEEPADNSYGQSSKEVLANSISGVHQEENNNNSNLFDEDADPFGLKGGDLFEEKDNTFGGKTQSLEEEPEKEDVKEEAVQGSGAESPEKVGEEVIDIEDVEETAKTEDDKAVTEEDQLNAFLTDQT